MAVAPSLSCFCDTQSHPLDPLDPLVFLRGRFAASLFPFGPPSQSMPRLLPALLFLVTLSFALALSVSGRLRFVVRPLCVVGKGK